MQGTKMYTISIQNKVLLFRNGALYNSKIYNNEIKNLIENINLKV